MQERNIALEALLASATRINMYSKQMPSAPPQPALTVLANRNISHEGPPRSVLRLTKKGSD